MTGNVKEWVRDFWDDEYYDYSPYQDPQGPGSRMDRVMRNGSYGDYYAWVRCAYRHGVYPTYAYPNVGFRCAR